MTRLLSPFRRFGAGLATIFVVPLMLSCGSSVEPATDSAIEVNFTTTGVNQDPDGYAVYVDFGGIRNVSINGSTTFDPVQPGAHSLYIDDVAVTCDVDDGPARGSDGRFTLPVTAPIGETAIVDVTMVCTDKPIVFASDRSSNNLAIHRMNDDGTGVVSLGANGVHPRWSPDGSSIAFHMFADDDGEIFVMSADGSDLQEVVSAPGFSSEGPSWSPDGTRLVFAQFDGFPTIWAVDSDGNNLEQLTDFDSLYPDWGPDGRIVFSSLHAGENHFDVQIMNADGSNVTLVTHDGRNPTWSPDGSTIAFTSNRDLDTAIFLVNSDGSNERRRTAVGSDEAVARWSADGVNLVFEVYEEGPPNIGIGPAASFNTTVLAPDFNTEVTPDWR